MRMIFFTAGGRRVYAVSIYLISDFLVAKKHIISEWRS